MQIAAQDVSRLSRLIAGCAGIAVAVLGTLPLLESPDLPSPAVALLPAGLALVLAASRATGRLIRLPAALLAALTGALGALSLPDHPATGVGMLLAGLAIALIDVRLPGRPGGTARYRFAHPLLAGAAGCALVALVPRMVDGVKPPYAAAALLILAVGGILARPVAEPPDRHEFAATLLQSMHEAVMVLDDNYRVIDVNRRWHELTGHHADEALGSRPESLPPPGTGDWQVRHKDGTEVPVLATMAAVPAADGRPRAYVATYVDIADRKRAEESLNRHAADLMRSNEQLREANARLANALAFKNDLTSMLTHDVAQPISSIASLSELLTADWADLPDDIRLELATKIDKNTHRLIKMMSDLQLLFRLDTGSITARRTPVPLLEVVRAVAGEVSDDLEVSVAEELSALADRGHLAVVVQNLLKNALTYGEGPVQIRAERHGESVLLTVRDHGPGIPPDLLPGLFDRFVRGAGLGLFIVRHLVEANGGAVRYERAEPRGARLIVTLESASLPGG